MKETRSGLSKRVLIDEVKMPIHFDILNTDSRKSFRELAEYTGTVIFPWEHALMSFYEAYSMGMPLFLPHFEW